MGERCTPRRPRSGRVRDLVRGGPRSPPRGRGRSRCERALVACRDQGRPALAAPCGACSRRLNAETSFDRDNTNVRRDADVDVAAEWTDTFKVHTWRDTAGMTAEQLGYVRAVEPVTPAEFRRRVERANDRVPVRHGRHDAGQAHRRRGRPEHARRRHRALLRAQLRRAAPPPGACPFFRVKP